MSEHRSVINVLLVEDNPGHARLIQDLLVGAQDTAFIVECAADLATGLALLRDKAVDVIVLDLMLPDSKGLDTFAEVQAEASAMPIVVLTGLADETTGVKAVQQGAQDYLIKDFVDGDVLARALRYAIERKRTEVELRRYQNHLEDLVTERTSALRKANARLRQEVAERKRLEDVARRSEARFRTVADFTYDWETWIDPQGRYLYVSPSCERITGYSAEVFLDNPGFFERILHPDDRARVMVHRREELTHCTGRTLNFRIIDRDGAVHWIEHIGQTVYDDAGDSLGVRASNRDITARLRAERALVAHARALEESERRLKTAQRLARMGDWSFDVAASQITWSAMTYALYERDPALGPPGFEEGLALYHPQDAARLRENVQRAVAEGKPYQMDLRVTLPSGRAAYFFATGTPIMDSEGRVVRLVGTVQDVTARHRAEVLLEQRAYALQRTNAELQQLAYAISHDVAAPLRVVKFEAEHVAERCRERLGDEDTASLHYIVEEVLWMERLIHDLREYSRVQSRGAAFAPTDCEEVLAHVLYRLQFDIEAQHAQVTHDALPSVSGDEAQLAQLFQNLISNALKFQPQHQPSDANEPPRVHISADLLPLPSGEGRGEGQWRFAVRDNGIGIPERDFGRIFEFFQRLHTQEEYEGTGMGLAICKRIVERHGGRIWLESKVGEGTTFYFTLPGGKVSRR